MSYFPPAPTQRPRRMGWGWGVAGLTALVVAISLFALRPEVIGPSVSRWLGAQLVLVGVLMAIMALWRDMTLTFVILGAVNGVGDIVLAVWGVFGNQMCGYGQGSPFQVWLGHTPCSAHIAGPEFEKWAIVGAIGFAVVMAVAYAVFLLRRTRPAVR